MKEKEERMLADELTKYVKQKHTSDECIGFIDGFELALQLAKNNEVLDLVVCCPLCKSDNTTVESDGIWCNGCDEWTSTKE